MKRRADLFQHLPVFCLTKTLIGLHRQKIENPEEFQPPHNRILAKPTEWIPLASSPSQVSNGRSKIYFLNFFLKSDSGYAEDIENCY